MPIERASRIIGDRWSLLILREISLGPQRFKTLKKNIAEISMDQLSRKLEHLCARGMIVRQEFSEAPPRVEYQLTELGLSFLPVLKKLLLWSAESLWSSPQIGEEPDAALSLRVIVSLLGQGEGLILLRLFSTPTTLQTYLVHRSGEGRVRVQSLEQAELAANLKPDAQVELSTQDWLKILSAKSDDEPKLQVRVAGNVALLQKILPIFLRPGIHEGPNGDSYENPVRREDSVRVRL